MPLGHGPGSSSEGQRVREVLQLSLPWQDPRYHSWAAFSARAPSAVRPAWPGASWKGAAPEEPSASCHPLGSGTGPLLSCSPSPPWKHSSTWTHVTLLSLFIFITQNICTAAELYFKPLPVPAVCSQLELKTSARRGGRHRTRFGSSCAPGQAASAGHRALPAPVRTAHQKNVQKGGSAST